MHVLFQFFSVLLSIFVWQSYCPGHYITNIISNNKWSWTQVWVKQTSIVELFNNDNDIFEVFLQMHTTLFRHRVSSQYVVTWTRARTVCASENDDNDHDDDNTFRWREDRKGQRVKQILYCGVCYACGVLIVFGLFAHLVHNHFFRWNSLLLRSAISYSPSIWL